MSDFGYGEFAAPETLRPLLNETRANIGDAAWLGFEYFQTLPVQGSFSGSLQGHHMLGSRRRITEVLPETVATLPGHRSVNIEVGRTELAKVPRNSRLHTVEVGMTGISYIDETEDGTDEPADTDLVTTDIVEDRLGISNHGNAFVNGARVDNINVHAKFVTGAPESDVTRQLAIASRYSLRVAAGFMVAATEAWNVGDLFKDSLLQAAELHAAWGTQLSRETHQQPTLWYTAIPGTNFLASRVTLNANNAAAKHVFDQVSM